MFIFTILNICKYFLKFNYLENTFKIYLKYKFYNFKNKISRKV